MIRAHDVLTGTGGRIVGALSRNELFHRVVHDSRDIQPDDLFVAIRGEFQDGHRYVPDAYENGASAVLVSEEWYRQYDLGDLPAIVVPDTLVALQELATYWRSLYLPHVIGITGSIGKSSTKEIIAAIAGQRFRVTRSAKSFNNEIGLPLSVLEITPDTEVVVLEMGGAYRFGEIRELAEIARPTIGVVTNVSHSHLGRMGTLEAIAETKAELVESLPEHGIAVLNIDDERVRRMAERAKGSVVFFGLSDGADVRATDVASHGLEGISFTLHYRGRRDRVSLPLLGMHSIHMALVGFALGFQLGLAFEEIVAGFQQPNIQLRLLLVPAINGATLLDDTYNANPASSLAALNLLDELDARRKVAVFGDMMELGSFETEGHRMVGERASQVVDALYVMGERARIIGEKAAESRPSMPIEYLPDKPSLLEALRDGLQDGDLVLIKGSRSLELETVVAALRDERDEE